MWKVCNKNKIEKGGVANGTWSKDKCKRIHLKKMFYLKFLPILEQKLSKTYFNLLLFNHFTSKGKNKTSLRDNRNKCQKSHQIGIEQVNSKENENNLYLLTQNKKDAHILKKYKKKKKKSTKWI